MPRHASVVVDLDAVCHNVAELVTRAEGARLCAVVKANGYGHGAVPVTRAVLGAGATWLAVATVEEGAELRDAGITEPILLLSEPPLDSLGDACGLGLTPTIYHRDALEVAAAAAQGGTAPWAVHLKVDTGMHRVGMPPADLHTMAAAVHASDSLTLGGVFTHLAVADAPKRPETTAQLECFERALAVLREAGIDPGIVHVANSAAVIAHRGTAFDLVRCGISVYGIAPSPALESMIDLRPAMSVTTEVGHTLTVPAGEATGYGLTHHFDVDTTVAVLPVGYADGVPRSLGANGGEVLIGGVRRPIRGVVTMDQITVEIGPVTERTAPAVRRGDEAVLIGSQRSPVSSGGAVDHISASEWAAITDTIAYEIVCGFSARMAREYR